MNSAHHMNPWVEYFQPKESGALIYDARGQHAGEYGSYLGQSGEVTGIRIIYPHDIEVRKSEVDAKAKSVLLDVQNCVALTDEERRSFSLWYDDWRKFYGDGKASSIWGLGGQMDDCEAYDLALYDWQKKFASKCSMSAPIVRPHVEHEVPLLPGGTEEILKWAVIGVAVVGGIWMFGPALRTVASGAARRTE